MAVAFRLATLEREGQELIDRISNHEDQLRTASNDDRRKELRSALEIDRLELEIHGYEIEYENAASNEAKGRLFERIKSTRKYPQQQKRSSGRPFFIFRF
jgi:hypothetical protein